MSHVASTISLLALAPHLTGRISASLALRLSARRLAHLVTLATGGQHSVSLAGCSFLLSSTYTLIHLLITPNWLHLLQSFILFTTEELSKFPWQLTMYISHVPRDERFKNFKNLCELSVKLVDTEKDEQYYVVYKLLKLVLILPIWPLVLKVCFPPWIIWRTSKGTKWVMGMWTIAWLLLLRENFSVEYKISFISSNKGIVGLYYSGIYCFIKFFNYSCLEVVLYSLLWICYGNYNLLSIIDIVHLLQKFFL